MITVLLGNLDVTNQVTLLTWSTSDPGGFESCSFTLPDQTAGDHIGDTVRIMDGMETVWMGRVNEPGADFSQRRTAQEFACTGARASLSDNQASMVFIDRDLNEWRTMGAARRVSLGASWRVESMEVTQDQTTGAPGIKLSYRLEGNAQPICEAWYDAGQGNLIAKVMCAYTTVNGSTTDAAFTLLTGTRDTDDGTGTDETTADLIATATSGDGGFTPTTGYRYVIFQWRYDSTTSASPGVDRIAMFTNVALIGDHGIEVQSVAGDMDGLYPEDVVQWVVDQGIDEALIGQGHDYIIPHLVYRTPVPYDQILDDMASILGWHWGMWEPSSIFSDKPVLHFVPPPDDATATVNNYECDGLQLTQQLSEMYNKARISFQDVAGVPGYVTVTRANSRIPAGVTRTVEVDLGISSATVAQQYGEDYLALLEASGRAAGSCTLPREVRRTTGATVPAHFLKPGRDRLKIVGVQDTTAALVDADTRRFDTFHIKRLTATLQPGGGVQTTVELDSGANLLDVLNARLAIATKLGGF